MDSRNVSRNTDCLNGDKATARFPSASAIVARTVNYINNQPAYHGKMDFKTEFRAFLKKRGIEYDERFIFD